MTHQVLERRVVPSTELAISFTGHDVVTINNHGGKRATCVKLADGRIAWGFADTREGSEADAVANAYAIPED